MTFVSPFKPNYSRIGRVLLDAAHAGVARHVDYRAASRGYHRLGHDLRDQGGGPEVDGEGLVPVVGVEFQYPLGDAEARVVYEYVDDPDSAQNRVAMASQAEHRPSPRHTRCTFRPLLLDLFRERTEFLVVAPVAATLAPCRGKSQRDIAPDSLGRPSHYRGLTREIEAQSLEAADPMLLR